MDGKKRNFRIKIKKKIKAEGKKIEQTERTLKVTKKNKPGRIVVPTAKVSMRTL